MTSQLIGSDFTSAAQLPNYVNGRLLTAEDLATSQATLCARDIRLGQAAGHGIVTGLRVTSTATTLTVAPGMGMASSGAVISVGAAVTLPLTFASPAGNSAAGASFSCCTPAPAVGNGPAVTAGCYLLTALPACQLTGQAPLASPPDSTAPAGCTAQWQAQGTQFKAIAVSLGDTVLGITVTDDNRRNLLAQWCLGSPQLANLAVNLLTFAPGYGGFDLLDPADLTAADLPLAVFYWNGQAVGFVDNWSARRRVTAPDPVSSAWSGVTSDRRSADGQARLLQFQEQAAELVDSGAADTVRAATMFPLLPPAGFLPIGIQHLTGIINQLRAQVERIRTAARAGQGAPAAGPTRLFAADPEVMLDTLARLSTKGLDAVGATASTEPGFNPFQFFSGATQDFAPVADYGGVIDWEVADFLLRQSWENMPADATVTIPKGEQGPMTWYLVLQNFVPGLHQGANLYVVFVKNYLWLPGTLPPFIFAVPGLGSDAIRE
jgi:hypothetical protein